MDFYTKLIELCKQKGVSRSKMADDIGISRSAPQGWAEKGAVPRFETIKKIADYFGVPVSYFSEGSYELHTAHGLNPIKRKRLPMLGTVACGEPTFADMENGVYVSADADVDADFCLTARGDSMINARIFNGDLLFVKRQEIVADGEIAVVLIEDDTTVKRVYYDKENNVITLVPENPMYKPMRYVGAQLDRIRILGKVVAGQYITI